MRAVMNLCKRKGNDTIYSLYYISRRKMRMGWPLELVEEGSARG